jgi:hypothetical protein
MKITNHTRINSVIFQKNDKEILLHSLDQNMTLGEYLGLSLPYFISSKGKMPNPFEILDMDFQVEDVFVNETGHTFTTLVNKSKNHVCFVVKLDLVGKL